MRQFGDVIDDDTNHVTNDVTKIHIHDAFMNVIRIYMKNILMNNQVDNYSLYLSSIVNNDLTIS